MAERSYHERVQDAKAEIRELLGQITEPMTAKEFWALRGSRQVQGFDGNQLLWDMNGQEVRFTSDYRILPLQQDES